MVDKLRGKYLFQKRGVYYFSKQIPKDVRQHYSQNRIVQSLKTKSVKDAFYQSQNLLHKLNQHWFYLRVKDENILLFPYQFTQQTLQKRVQNKMRSKLYAYAYTPRVALAVYFLSLIIKGRIKKGRQKMKVIYLQISLIS